MELWKLKIKVNTEEKEGQVIGKREGGRGCGGKEKREDSERRIKREERGRLP